MNHKHTCKFCGWGWSEDCPCEAGFDPDTFEPYLCGNQSCPACLSCQGRIDVNERTIEQAQMIRAQRMHREDDMRCIANNARR